MNGNEFLEKLEFVNPQFIEEADIKPNVKKHFLVKLIVVAASICLVLTAGVFAADYFNLFNGEEGKKIIVEHASAAGFSIDGNNDIIYFPISFDDCKRYGIIRQDAIGLSREDAYEITSADIGELMGTVTNCDDQTLAGRNVYHYLKFPDYDSICIVDTGSGYQFYTGSYFLGKWFNLSSNQCLDKYDLPNSLKKIEIINSNSQVLFEIKDKDDISLLFDIISNKEDIGDNEQRRRMADAWYKEYQNDDLYYDQATGQIVYKNANEIIKEGYTSVVDGVEITFEPQFGNTATQDKAIELWNRNSCNILITSNNGFSITVNYSPITSTFSISNNNYSLTEDEVKELNSLLKITE